jgi:serine/threonine protein phosphatase PrpC
MLLLGVFDGHGVEGRTVSNTICQQLPGILARTMTAKVVDPCLQAPLTSQK